MSKPKIGFKDFLETQPVTEFVHPEAEVIEVPEVENDIPALFATIHFKSADRPDGHTSKEIWEMNNAANAHLPHLQKPWPYGDSPEPV